MYLQITLLLMGAALLSCSKSTTPATAEESKSGSTAASGLASVFNPSGRALDAAQRDLRARFRTLASHTARMDAPDCSQGLQAGSSTGVSTTCKATGPTQEYTFTMDKHSMTCGADTYTIDSGSGTMKIDWTNVSIALGAMTGKLAMVMNFTGVFTGGGLTAAALVCTFTSEFDLANPTAGQTTDANSIVCTVNGNALDTTKFNDAEDCTHT